uniref:Uncharacterized protein n=1 Tax=Clytia hemisphaerica TaxID=252671 RepID=A0A7M5XBP7_9CNID
MTLDGGLTKRNFDITSSTTTKTTHRLSSDDMNKKRKAQKSVRFADDHGYLLVKNFNLPSRQCSPKDSVQTPARKLSKVTNFTECQKENNNFVYLESVATTKAAVFGTIVVQDKTIDTDLLRVIYSWDSRTRRTSEPFLVVPGKSGRLLFKVPVPRLKTKTVDETRTLLVNFYITYKGKRLNMVNDGKDFVVTWSNRQ